MKLETYLEAHDIQPEKFAEMIGKHPESVRLYLKGQVIPRRDAMERIIKATNGKVQANDFFQAA